jgi:uncharacterized membrane protein
MNIVDLLLIQHWGNTSNLWWKVWKCWTSFQWGVQFAWSMFPYLGVYKCLLHWTNRVAIVSPLFIEHAEFVSGLGDLWKCRLLWIVEVRVCMVLTSSWGVWASKLIMVLNVLKPVARHFHSPLWSRREVSVHATSLGEWASRVCIIISVPKLVTEHNQLYMRVELSGYGK